MGSASNDFKKFESEGILLINAPELNLNAFLSKSVGEKGRAEKLKRVIQFSHYQGENTLN